MDSEPVSSDVKNRQNLEHWDGLAEHWDVTVGEGGNDMQIELVTPTLSDLAGIQPHDRVLDLGTGNGIHAVRFARAGANVTATDGSPKVLNTAERRVANEPNLTHPVTFEVLDLVNKDALDDFAARHPSVFDVIVICMTLKHLADLGPLARALPKLLSPTGRVVVVDMHPAFSKPAGHRSVEVFENDATGIQEFSQNIIVRRYLDIPTVKTQALRDQPDPFLFFHRPISTLFETFFSQGLTLDGIREPAFTGPNDPSQIQSYHNFQQFPMLLAFRLRLADRTR